MAGGVTSLVRVLWTPYSACKMCACSSAGMEKEMIRRCLIPMRPGLIPPRSTVSLRRRPKQKLKEARLSLRLSPEARAAVEKIMQLGNMDTMQEAIRRAIGEELFLMTERRAGWKVLLQKGERYREVIFPQI